MITAVSSFKASNYKSNSTNYDAKNSVMSNVVSFNQNNDSFTKSNQVSFKGNLAAKVGEGILGDAGSKVGGIARRLGEETSEAIDKGFRILTKEKSLPITETPVVLPSYTGDIHDLAQRWNKLHPGNTVPVPAEGCDVSYAEKIARMIHNKDSSFKGLIDTSDIHEAGSEIANSAAGEAVKEAGSAIAESAAGETVKEAGLAIAESAFGETVKTVASEVGQTIVAEIIEEAGHQIIERGIDLAGAPFGVPGIGIPLTVARWGRRAYKAEKLGEKVAKGLKEEVNVFLDKALDAAVEAQATEYVKKHGEEIDKVMTRAAEKRLDEANTWHGSEIDKALTKSISHLSRKKQVKIMKQLHGPVDFAMEMLKKKLF